MRPEQKIVAVGAASGIVLTALAVWGLSRALPAPIHPLYRLIAG